MAERAPKSTPGERIRREHQSINRGLVPSLAAEDLLVSADGLTYSELLERIKKHKHINLCDSEALMAEASRWFFATDQQEMSRKEAANWGRRCVELAALLYYYANNVYSGSWPCILQKFKSRIIVDALLHGSPIWLPLSMDKDWYTSRGLVLVDTSKKFDLSDKNWGYVTNEENISAIRQYEKRAGDRFLKLQPSATDATHESWKHEFSSQETSDILSKLADLANRGDIQFWWWPDLYVPIQVYETLDLDEELGGHFNFEDD
ncbi:hypothetical protein MY10362_001687 [Beauveria mimosiformis]